MVALLVLASAYLEQSLQGRYVACIYHGENGLLEVGLLVIILGIGKDLARRKYCLIQTFREVFLFNLG